MYRCSLRTKNPEAWGWATSDNCNEYAAYVVLSPDKGWWFRCAAHRDKWTIDDHGGHDYSLEMPIRLEEN